MTDTGYHWTIDAEEAAENAMAEIIGFRANPQRSGAIAVSMVRSQYRNAALEIASNANGEKTREQLEFLAITETTPAIEFFAFCAGYLAARMFMPSIGQDPVLSRLLLADDQPIADDLRRASLERAVQYLPALSEIHDNRAAPRDSRLVQKLLAGYLAVLVEDPRHTTLETLLRGYEEPDARRGVSGFSARQIADALDSSRNWATLGWRRGLAERRFRPGPRAAYLENISGDVRVLLDRDGVHAGFSDIRRLRHVTLGSVRETPHPCDDATVSDWIALNCELASQTAQGR